MGDGGQPDQYIRVIYVHGKINVQDKAFEGSLMPLKTKRPANEGPGANRDAGTSAEDPSIVSLLPGGVRGSERRANASIKCSMGPCECRGHWASVGLLPVEAPAAAGRGGRCSGARG